jgi:CBS domain-containing protein
MNIAAFIQPKIDVAYLRDNMTVRQGLEKLKRSGYSAIPVIDTEDRYVGVVSEGDFLWNIIANNENLDGINMKNAERLTVRDIIQSGKINAVCIDTNMEQLMEQAKNQNFVPVIDDRSIFIGIITRRDILTYFTKKFNMEHK